MAQPRTPDPGAIGDAFAELLGGGLGYGAPDTDKVTAGANQAASIADATGVGDAVDGIRAVRRWVSDRHNWIRVGYFLGGAWLFGVGAVMVAGRPASKAAAPIVNLATGAAPTGRIGKAVKAVKG